jgi:threonine dehydrogenase-like Zn-dependent dehydrogenase
MPGGAYGFAMMGGWQGGQSEYVLVPWADFQLLKLPKEVAMQKMTSLAFLSDIFPTGEFASRWTRMTRVVFLHVRWCPSLSCAWLRGRLHLLMHS